MKVGPRLEKLEARMPKGCSVCRTWHDLAFVDDEGWTHRPERCPECGRLVPISITVRIVGIDLDLV